MSVRTTPSGPRPRHFHIRGDRFNRSAEEASQAHDLVLSDGSALQAQLRKRYHELAKKLEKLKSEWNAYESDAQREFHQWYHTTFSQDLSELRLLQDEASEIHLMMDAIQAQIIVNGLTQKQAYKKVTQAVEEKRDPMPSTDEINQMHARLDKKQENDLALRLRNNHWQVVDSDLIHDIYVEVKKESQIRFDPPMSSFHETAIQNWIDDEVLNRYAEQIVQKTGLALESLWTPPKARNKKSLQGEKTPRRNAPTFDHLFEYDDDNESVMEDVFEEFFGSRTGKDRGHSLDQDRKTPLQNQDGEDYKNLYRQIVRLLHPDRGRELSPIEQELWHHTQHAYRLQDAVGLKTILLRIENGGKIDLDKLSSLGQLQQLVDRLAQEITTIEFLKSRERKDPVYRFWASKKRPKNRATLAVQIRTEIRGNIFSLARDLKFLRQEISRFGRSS